MAPQERLTGYRDERRLILLWSMTFNHDCPFFMKFHQILNEEHYCMPTFRAPVASEVPSNLKNGMETS